MRGGFLYLVAIMDRYSRKVPAWRLSNTLEADFRADALKEAPAGHGKPEIFTTLTRAQILIEQWSRFYNTERPHSSPGSRPPVPETVLPRRPTIPYAATLIGRTVDWTLVGFQLKGRITKKTPHR